MKWSPNSVALLRVLWRGDIATPEIARRLGATKNAVIGKANRLGLRARVEGGRHYYFSRPNHRASREGAAR